MTNKRKNCTSDTFFGGRLYRENREHMNFIFEAREEHSKLAKKSVTYIYIRELLYRRNTRIINKIKKRGNVGIGRCHLPYINSAFCIHLIVANSREYYIYTFVMKAYLVIKEDFNFCHFFLFSSTSFVLFFFPLFYRPFSPVPPGKKIKNHKGLVLFWLLLSLNNRCMHNKSMGLYGNLAK